jgi:hypothetical protein
MKYYFITYQATNKQGTISTWSDVTNESPMDFIKRISSIEERGSRTYNNFVVINTCEISRTEFEKFKNSF